MRNYSLQKGMTVVEVVVAIGIFAVLSTVAYQVHIGSDRLIVKEGQKSKALWLAEEGIEASRSIRDVDYASLTNGTRGIAVSGNTWTFSGTEDSTDGYVRSITIADAGADAKNVQSNVSWSDRGATSTVTLSTVLTNWHKSIGGMADSLTVNATAANLSFASGRKLLTGINLVSDGSVGTTTISQINVSWTKSPGDLNRIYSPNGTTVYGPATILSGSTVTLSSPIILNGVTTRSIEFLFSNNMQSSNFTLTFIMSDGSSKTVTITNPPTGL